jgi:Tfp pilus assembly ATPase PilU
MLIGSKSSDTILDVFRVGIMKSFDQHAVELYRQGLVTKEEAISACSNKEGFERIISGIKSSEGRKILK